VGVRAEQKRESRQRILDAASRVLRMRGLDGVGVASIMSEAGLTHGGFYVHFDSRRDLVAQVLREASESARGWYFRGLSGRAGLDWVRAAVRRYLTPRHRDTPQAGCIIAGLSGDLAREEDDMREVFDGELAAVAKEFREHLEEGGVETADERALAILALCAGGITLSRAVADRRLSNRILRACQRLAERDLGDGR
jgi:TetR/AcrR family transcriptional repressor of nem operon